MGRSSHVLMLRDDPDVLEKTETLLKVLSTTDLSLSSKDTAIVFELTYLKFLIENSNSLCIIGMINKQC